MGKEKADSSPQDMPAWDGQKRVNILLWNSLLPPSEMLPFKSNLAVNIKTKNLLFFVVVFGIVYDIIAAGISHVGISVIEDF